MSKIIACNAGLALVTVGVVIASLVLNILILNQVNAPPPEPPTVAPSTPAPNTPGCKVSGTVSNKDGWKNVSQQLQRGLNRGIDPCSDFYTFSCDAFIQDKDNAKSTYSEAQLAINLGIADYLDGLNTKKAIQSDLISKKAYDLCSDSMMEVPTVEVIKGRVDEVQKDLLDFVQFPLFGFTAKSTELKDLFTKIGRVERHFLTSILLGSGATIDYKNNQRTAVYVDQAGLSLPRDYYVLPQFISDLQDYSDGLIEMLQEYSAVIGQKAKCNNFDTSDECITEFVQWAVNLEVQIALASWDGSELRNYKQQYNPFKVDELKDKFKSLPIKEYIMELTDGQRPDPFDTNIIIDQPSYMAWLDALIDSEAVSTDQLTNYLAMLFLADTADYHYLGALARQKRRVAGAPLSGLDAIQPPAVRKGRGTRKLSYKPTLAADVDQVPDSVKNYCVEMLIVYLPYAPGYIYVKNRADKYDVQTDVADQTRRIVNAFSDMIDSLDWMDDDGKAAAHEKSKQLIQNIGWPSWYEPFDGTAEATLDAYHTDYLPIINATTYWEASKTMKYGLETREFWAMLSVDTAPWDGPRGNFLQSPAMVNAWYQPERNSITFPLANMNPPYYSLDYPQAYNYAGQGGTGGHELTHGYDDEGVQFGPYGELADCEFTHCSILDDNSRQGFSDMAQCVVQQFNLQCCPVKTGNVRCANGANTQGENIADIGGQQAAYRAYLNYVQEELNNVPEDLLPGLEDFTTNQIFWMSYAFSWCSKTSTSSLVSQLETDVHSPSICRVNQVMQDIPQFGRDFKCSRGSTLYPTDDDRCKVWVGM